FHSQPRSSYKLRVGGIYDNVLPDSTRCGSKTEVTARKVETMTKYEPAAGDTEPLRPAHGSIRPCVPYRGELARHRLITADGSDYVVATLFEARRNESSYLTGAYPVTRGYLVMMRQPLYEIRSADEVTACSQHERLVSVLAEAG